MSAVSPGRTQSVTATSGLTIGAGASAEMDQMLGENLFLRHGFLEVLEKRAADIIMPDLQKAGGLGEGQRIANEGGVFSLAFLESWPLTSIALSARSRAGRSMAI